MANFSFCLLLISGAVQFRAASQNVGLLIAALAQIAVLPVIFGPLFASGGGFEWSGFGSGNNCCNIVLFSSKYVYYFEFSRSEKDVTNLCTLRVKAR